MYVGKLFAAAEAQESIDKRAAKKKTLLLVTPNVLILIVKPIITSTLRKQSFEKQIYDALGGGGFTQFDPTGPAEYTTFRLPRPPDTTDPSFGFCCAKDAS